MMRNYTKICPQFWIGKTGKQIKQLGLKAQLVALYLISSPHANMLGVYYLPVVFIAHETGIPFKGALKALQMLCQLGFCTYDTQSEYVWVHEMAFYQIGENLKPTDNRVKAINEVYETLPDLPFLKEFYDKYENHLQLEKMRENTESSPPSKPLISPLLSPSEAPSKPLRSQKQKQEHKQEQEQEQEQVAVSPPPCQAPPEVPGTPVSHPVITIPLNDHSEYPVGDSMLAEWQELYPGTDVLQELRKIRGWNLANPTRRKTKTGILKHINAWLSKTQNEGGCAPMQKQSTFSLFEYNKSVGEQWLSEEKAIKNLNENSIQTPEIETIPVKIFEKSIINGEFTHD